MPIKDTIGNIFNFLSETNLVEEYFYNNKGEYPVYSGQTDSQGVVAKIDTFNQEEPCVTFTTYGNAGKLFFREGKYTIGRNCMGLKPKAKYKNEINLKWFSYSFQNLFYHLRIGDPDGQKSLNQLLIKRILIEIPEIAIQLRHLEKYEKLINLKKSITAIINELKNILRINSIYAKDEIIAKDRLSNFFIIHGGNNGLTEEFIYENLPNNEIEKIKILTSSTLDRTAMGFININSRPYGKKLKIFNGPAIIIARNGYAGTMTYISEGKFTINDHAYVLEIKQAWIHKILFEWILIEYQELFWRIVTSKSDNATFSKEYAERQIISIPIKEEQIRIINRIKPIEVLINQLLTIINKIDEILEYTIY